MSSRKILIILVISILVASCATSLETTNVSIFHGYKRVFAQNLGGPGTLTEYIPVNESPKTWSKMFTIQFLNIPNKTPREAMQHFTKRAKSRCKNNFSYKILSDDKNSITYEQSVSDCKQIDNMKYISRGVQIEDCNINYFTGLMWNGSKIMKGPDQCNKHVAETEIIRILKGNDGLHRISLTKKGGKIKGIERKRWLENLQRAFVVKDGSKVIVN